MEALQLSLFDFRERKKRGGPQFKAAYITQLTEHLKSNSLYTFCAALDVKGVNDTKLYQWFREQPAFRKVWMDHKELKARVRG